ncbi:cation diffusion facilitator family transporter [Pseudanabaena sp. PCC 6802]|uniref:cation diffusion facilitator family transporter n=1 Tax=Pseudanabaena sp. PCC 6802 TaxID=118173 RepID=UPI0004772556|nr:cation diffusion facilitator family transporter [Pseudanabaena sp. PCC 6802]
MTHRHGHKHAHNHHEHSHGDRGHHSTNYNRAFVLGLLLNGGFVVTELIFGVLANSVALIADAGHNLSDVLGLLLAWIASLLARRQPSARYTYGWRKSSVLAAFLNAVFLLVATGGIIWEAIQRLVHPGEVNGAIVIGVAIVGIAINTGTALMFLSGRKGDLNIRAAFQHMMADAMVSLGVVIAGIAILFTHWLWLDPAVSLIISFAIVFGTWGLLKDSFHLAIDGVPHNIDERAVRTYLSEHSGVAQVHDLHIWSMSTVETALTAHLVIPTGHPGDMFLTQIAQELRDRFGIHHATVQIEVGDSDRPCLLESKCQI